MASSYGEKVLLPTTTITTALTAFTTAPFRIAGQQPKYLGLEGTFVYGSGGTTVKVWLQTSFDGGSNWFDILNFAYTTASLRKVGALSTTVAAAAPATPTDGALADNTINNGLLGTLYRLKITTTGTYAGGTTLTVKGVAN